jgi:hypothetical protein
MFFITLRASTTSLLLETYSQQRYMLTAIDILERCYITPTQQPNDLPQTTLQLG